MADMSHSVQEWRDIFPDKRKICPTVLAVLHPPWTVSVVVELSHLVTEFFSNPQILKGQ